MDVIVSDDRPNPISSYGGPPPSPVHCMPPLEVSHGLPSHPSYEPAWRSFPPGLDGPSSSEQRRHSTPSQLPPPTLGYPPPPPNRELPQIPPPEASSYVRSNALPIPPVHSPDVHPPHANYRPMNGVAPDTLPPPGPGEYRPRLGYSSHEAPTNGEQPPPPPQPPPPSLAPGQYTPGPPIPTTSSSYEASYYHGQMFGTRQRKAARAQQVSKCGTIEFWNGKGTLSNPIPGANSLRPPNFLRQDGWLPFFFSSTRLIHSRRRPDSGMRSMSSAQGQVRRGSTIV